jgi:hypothetical protein
VFGGVCQIAINLHDGRPSADLYLHAILPFAISSVVIVVIVHIVEWASRKVVEQKFAATKREP